MMNINWKELRELELNNLGAWPLPMIIVLMIFVSLFILLMGYWFDIKNQFERLAYAQSEEVKLKTDFVTKSHQAANLSAYKLQLENMKKMFGGLLRQLPEQTEVPALLEDISHQGLATGLEFQSIRLQPERAIDFYIELPIEISVVGNYQQFAEFVNNVAALPRIVTLHDFIIQPYKDQNTESPKELHTAPGKNVANRDQATADQSKVHNTDNLVMKITAKTYRYVNRDHKNDHK